MEENIIIHAISRPEYIFDESSSEDNANHKHLVTPPDRSSTIPEGPEGPEGSMHTSPELPVEKLTDVPPIAHTEKPTDIPPTEKTADIPPMAHTEKLTDITERPTDISPATHTEKPIDIPLTEIPTNVPVDDPAQISRVPRIKKIPKKILENQKIYEAILERQKTGKKQDHNNRKSSQTKLINFRRINIGGKIKLVPLVPVTKEEKSVEKNSEKDNLQDISISKEDSEQDTIVKIERMQRQGHALPAKYAKHMEKDIKKKTIRNIKSFTELRRFTVLESLPAEINTNLEKVSMEELRRLKMEQRRREQEQRKNTQNKKESLLQEILKDDKMTKFSKLIALRNITDNGRRKYLNRKIEKIKIDNSETY
jgi:hypothetical protein